MSDEDDKDKDKDKGKDKGKDKDKEWFEFMKMMGLEPELPDMGRGAVVLDSPNLGSMGHQHFEPGSGVHGSLCDMGKCETKAASGQKKKDWSKRYNSGYTPECQPRPLPTGWVEYVQKGKPYYHNENTGKDVWSAPSDDNVSDKFKTLQFDYMFLTNSHGGPTDVGDGGKNIRYMFTTNHNVIFPVRCGQLLHARRHPEPIEQLALHMPLSPTKLTGADLVTALHECEFTSGISQYDVGKSVPNLEIFTAGAYTVHKRDVKDRHAIDDDMFLYDCARHEFMSLKNYMPCIVDKVKKELVTVIKHKPKKSKKNNKKVTSTITKRVHNTKPLFSLKKDHKESRGYSDDTPLALSDFCEKGGLFETLVNRLKHDKLINANVEVSDIPVVVLACRCTDAKKPVQVDSPISENYITDSSNSAASSIADLNAKNPVQLDGASSAASSIADLDDGVGAFAGRDFDAFAGRGVGAFGPGAFGPDEGQYFDGAFGPGTIGPGVFDLEDGQYFDGDANVSPNSFSSSGGRNATKKRRNRRNAATKKRRN